MWRQTMDIYFTHSDVKSSDAISNNSGTWNHKVHKLEEIVWEADSLKHTKLDYWIDNSVRTDKSRFVKAMFVWKPTPKRVGVR